MPQINRIRVNNVKYNFGTQFYDDFMMSFSCKNAIYDLANGGGKSVLMLLLLQNLIPNCTLDEKQPVEKLFRTEGGSSVIHSLVEWKLDSCYQTDGYQYMTTGFCARKAKDFGEEGSRETAGIEYFNYCIFYKTFGDNDIKNLPLVSGGERITYNGLKAYLRELGKNDLSVSVRIFERKGDYQNFIAGYGLFESHWEIIRGINKTEGHVRAYFENNYRTARKVTEDLLIEEIIQKSYHSRIGISDEGDEMAKTLIDIKDKLIELSQKREQLSLYDQQISAMKDFGAYIGAFQDIMEEKASLKKELSDYLLKCRRLVRDKEQELADTQNKCDEAEKQMSREKYFIAAAKIMQEEQDLKEMTAAAEECRTLLDRLHEEENDKKKRLSCMEACGDYGDYLDAMAMRDGVLAAVENSMRDRGSVAEELYALASLKKSIHDRETAVLQDRLRQAEERLASAQTVLNDIAERKREEDITAAVFDSNAIACEKKYDEASRQLSQLLAACRTLVPSQLEEHLSFERENLNAVREKWLNDKKSLQETEEKQKTVIGRLTEAVSGSRQLENELDRITAAEKDAEQISEKLAVLSGIYKETEAGRLVDAVYTIYKSQLKSTAALEESRKSMETCLEGLINGKHILQGTQYNAVRAYLEEICAGDVVAGDEWYAGLDRQVKRDLIKRVPFVEYSFVIKGDFERIKRDERLKDFMNSSYVVPVISENIIYSTKLGVDNENVDFAMQDSALLKDEAKRAEAVSRAQEELENIREAEDKAKIRLNIVEEDYSFVAGNALRNTQLTRQLLEERRQAEEELKKLEEEKTELANIRETLSAKADKLKADIMSGEEAERQIQERITALTLAVDKKTETAGLLSDKKAFREEAAKSHIKLEELAETLRGAETEYQNVHMETERLEAAMEKRVNGWRDVYSSYYNPQKAPFDGAITEEDLDARFAGLRTVMENDAVDINDKKSLVKTYEAAMERCVRSIEYRGFTLEEAEELYRNESSGPADRQQMLRIKNELEVISGKHMRVAEEYASRNAGINRLEGSISYAAAQLKETYGEYTPFECPDIPAFISETEMSVKKNSENRKQLDKMCRSISDSLNEYRSLLRDLVKITANAGILLPDDIVYDGEVSDSDIKDYERTEKRFQTLIKSEYKKREEFIREKQKLSELLNGLNACDLGEEVARSIRIPENTSDIDDILQGIEEINQCIVLERDSVTAGIEDMEKIRDSFVSRCIQTCVNIKADLDRLPQLSKITLDGEVISMIGLVIPYVKEEFYRERMSQYISDTAALAESFKGYEERLKYIRGRLAWKKLFSVIVTDMNQIRIQLYKRERIRSQSRYLKYEEAVGSTGQSQGMYIQFLIAVINYIASINAAGREVSIMGKTIFIDNPFGAAKDVYIWEPIFGMLKTNHVQLIVPARGATPAITGRFDVNYILGQKMSGGMQQTVVVDYESSVKSEELEYTRLSYEQGSLFE